MKTAKLGAMFLISIMALTGIGVGYAAWTDTIYIQGTVNTGTVSWHFSDYSGMWAYKDPDGYEQYGELEIHTGAAHGNVVGAWDTGHHHLLVARSFAAQGADDHHAVVTFDNIFPLVTPACGFCADLTITYTGTVPGKINRLDITNNLGAIDAFTTITITVRNVAGEIIYQGVPQLGLQLHNGYTIHIDMCINPPETQASQGLSGSFSLTAGIIQWNEFVAD